MSSTNTSLEYPDTYPALTRSWWEKSGNKKTTRSSRAITDPRSKNELRSTFHYRRFQRQR